MQCDYTDTQLYRRRLKIEGTRFANMASSSLHGIFDMHSLPPTYQKTGKQPHIGVLPDVELESIKPNPRPQTPKTQNDLEASRPPTPTQDAAVDLVQTWNNPPMNKYRILCCCLIYFSNGLNDAGTSPLPPAGSPSPPNLLIVVVVGALIPYMEAYYPNSHTIMSLIFVGNAVGFIAAAPFVNWALARFGRARTLMYADAVLIAGFVMLVCTPPFGVVVVA